MGFAKWLSFSVFMCRYRAGLLPRARRAQLLADKLQSMGVLFVKIGQILSVQYNVLDPETRAALRFLQDRNDGADFRAFSVPGVVTEAAPFACGSIAHLYRGTREDDGSRVVVKVLRRDVLEDFRATKKMLRAAVKVLSVLPSCARLNLGELSGIVTGVLETQLDFGNELRNWRLMHDAYSGRGVVIPRMHEELCSETVLVMDCVEGHSVYDLPREVIQRKAEELVKVFFRGLLREGVVHADCHAGNIFWTKDEHARLGFYDFGIVQKVAPEVSRTFVRFYSNIFAGNVDTAMEVMLGSFVEGCDDERHAKSILALQKLFRARLSEGVDNVNIIRDLHRLYSENKGVTLRHDYTLLNITLLNIDGMLEAMARGLGMEDNHRFDILGIVRDLMRQMVMDNEIALE